MQTEEQRLKAMQDAKLNPTAQAGITGGYSTVGNINSNILNTTTQIPIPPPPADTNNYDAIRQGGQAAIDAYNKALETKTTTDTTTPDWLSKYISSPPSSVTEQYQTAYGESGIDKYSQDVLGKQTTLKTAQDKLSAINAQLAGINAEAQAIPIKTQQDVLKGGAIVTAGGLAPRTTAQLRENALKALPLQAQAIAAQAEIQAAQGNVELSQNTLKLAQDKLNTVFQLRTKDIENDYNYKKDLRDKVYAYATEAEKNKLNALQKKDDREFDMVKLEFTANKELSETAIENGQADLAARISSLDPKSKTYQADKAVLIGQIKPKVDEDLQYVSATANQPAGTFNKRTGVFTPTGGMGGGASNTLTGLTAEQQKDPFIQKMVSSAGGKPLTDTFAQSLNKGLSVLGQLGVLETNIKDTKTGPLVGLFRGANPWDTNAQTIKAQLNAIVPNLARGVYGEVGVLTDNDIKTYSSTLPNLKSTEDIRNAVLGITVDLIGKSIKRTLEVNEANGKDVSGFVDLYTEMQNTRDSIFSQIPGYKGSGTKSLQEIGITKEEEALFDSVITTSTISSGGFWSNLLKGLGI